MDDSTADRKLFSVMINAQDANRFKTIWSVSCIRNKTSVSYNIHERKRDWMSVWGFHSAKRLFGLDY